MFPQPRPAPAQAAPRAKYGRGARDNTRNSRPERRSLSRTQLTWRGRARAPRRGAAHERGVRQPVNPGARHLVAPLREHHEVLGDTVVLPVGQGIRLGARVAEDEIPREHPAHVLVLADGHLLQAIDIRFAALHHPLANIFTRRPAVSALLILRQGHPDIARRHAV